MPRGPRSQSPHQLYHVMLRGINRQKIFCDQEDYRYLIHLLDRFKETCGYQLHAYCLMGNHIHLLIQEGDEPLSSIFKRIGTAYVYWYNAKYERVGHLFQDRYKSEPINDDAYFLTAFRYILRNPVKAGLCSRPEEYPYSSAAEYLQGGKGITDTAFARSMLPGKAMREFVDQENEDQCLEVDETVRRKWTDEGAKELIQKSLGSGVPSVGKARERESLNRALRELLKAGVSIRQLSRLTGISKKVIENSSK